MKKSILAILLSIALTSVFGQNENDRTIYPDVVYHHKDGMALTMDIYVPSNNNNKGVVFINSGGFQSPFFSNQYVENNNSLSEVDKNNFVFMSLCPVNFAMICCHAHFFVALGPHRRKQLTAETITFVYLGDHFFNLLRDHRQVTCIFSRPMRRIAHVQFNVEA